MKWEDGVKIKSADTPGIGHPFSFGISGDSRCDQCPAMIVGLCLLGSPEFCDPMPLISI